jgi:catalase
MSGSAAPGTVIAQIVETMRALAGSHPGFRPVHAKGIVCSGTFRGAPQARGVSRAPHLQGPGVRTGLSVHCHRWHQPIRPLSLGARGGRSLSLP